MKEVSKEFSQSFVYATSCRTICQCGREHYVTDPYAGWEDGEVEELDKRNEEDSDQCVWHDYSSVHWFYWEDDIVVLDCPCKRAEMIEAYMWSRRDDIIIYLKKRIKQNLEEAQADQDSLVGLKVR